MVIVAVLCVLGIGARLARRRPSGPLLMGVAAACIGMSIVCVVLDREGAAEAFAQASFTALALAVLSWPIEALVAWSRRRVRR